MENYLNKVKQYIKKETLEPDNSQDYILGLNHALVLGESVTTKQELVKGLTNEALHELKEDEPNYLYIRAIVSALKEALKEEGEDEIPNYKVITPVHQIVKDKDDKVMPVKYVEGDYNEYWTLAELLTYDITLVEYAVEV